MITLGQTGISVSELCLGGNVFGWTADEAASCSILDRYLGLGGNFVDTADVYSAWATAHIGGESESVIGRWLSRRGRRDDVVIATKVGQLAGFEGLSATNIAAAADASLRRLHTDYIDLYYAHIDDGNAPLEETLGAFDELIKAGKVRCIGASNYSAARLSEALEVSAHNRLASYSILQTHYNLVHRHEFEDELADLCAERGIVSAAYYALADGFLTGKYRRGRSLPTSERTEDVQPYLNAGYDGVLQALDEVAANHRVSLAAVAVAWLCAHKGVIALASARTTKQLDEIMQSSGMHLSPDEIDLLDRRSAEATA